MILSTMLFLFFPLCEGAASNLNDDSLRATSRIVGGDQVRVGQYPWYVRLESNGRTKCGGALVAPDVVLTAAHCNPGGTNDDGSFPPSILRAHINAYTSSTRNIFDTQQKRETRSIRRAITHPSYVRATFSNDYMLLQLDQPVLNVNPVTWNRDPSIPFLNQPNLRVLGLGTVAERGPFSDTLREAVVTLRISPEQCRSNYLQQGYSHVLPELMFCAQGESFSSDETQHLPFVPFRDACQGDSGGAIFMPNRTRGGNPILVGLVSFGIGCGRERFPGVYARLSAVSSWLDSTLCTTSRSYRETSRACLTEETEQIASPESSNSSSSAVRPTPRPTSSPTLSPPTRNPTPQPTPQPTPSPTPPLRRPQRIFFFRGPSNERRPATGSSTTNNNNLFDRLPTTTATARKETKGCDDALDQTFSIGARRSRRDCIWLQNLSLTGRQRYCQPNQEAYHVCEETCGKCSDSCKDFQRVWFEIHPTSTGSSDNANGIILDPPSGLRQRREQIDCQRLRSRPTLRQEICKPSHAAYRICPETCNSCPSEEVRQQP